MAAFKNKDNGTWYVQFRYTDWKGEHGSNISGDSSARMMSGSLMPCIRSSNAGMSFFIRNAILMVTPSISNKITRL